MVYRAGGGAGNSSGGASLTTPLTGLSIGPNRPIVATDTILTGFGILQAEVNAVGGGTTGQLSIYKKTSTATSPAAPQTRFEVGRVSVPANKIGINAKVTFYAVAGKVSGGAGNEAFEMYIVPAAGTTFAPSTNRLSTGIGTGTGVNAGSVFYSQVLGNGTDKTNLKFAGSASAVFPYGGNVSSQFVGLTAISPAVPATAGIDFVITTTTTVDTTTVYDCWVEIHDPDATASGGSAQPTAWQTATIATPIVIDYSVSSNWYIPATLGTQTISVVNMPDGRSDLLVVLRGAASPGSGTWPAFSGAAPAVQGFTFDQPGNLPPANSSNPLLGTPVMFRSDNGGFNLRGIVSSTFVLTPP